MLIAYFADTLKIPWHRHHRTPGCSHNGLRDKGDNVFRAHSLYLSVKLVGHAQAIVAHSLGLPLVAISIAGADMLNIHQHGLKLLAPPLVTANTQSTQSIAMVALAASNKLLFAGLPQL